MKFYALPRNDGGVEIMQMAGDGDPLVDVAKWPPHRRAQMTGEVHEISEADYRAMPAQGPREAWTVAGGKLAINAAKKAEIDARPKPLTVEQRIADLESAIASVRSRP